MLCDSVERLDVFFIDEPVRSLQHCFVKIQGQGKRRAVQINEIPELSENEHQTSQETV